MAVAGRILIMPKGAYNSETTYEMLDLVSHNGTSWICKKTCVGIAPSEGEYWQHMFNVSAEDVMKLQSDVKTLQTKMTSVESKKISVEHQTYESDEGYFCESYKYSDGRMIINMRYDTYVDITLESGSLFFGTVEAKEFPVEFISKPTVTYACETDGTSNAFVFGRGQASATRTPLLYAGRGASATQVKITIVLTADGRWK